jgi:hypothetical protein
LQHELYKILNSRQYLTKVAVPVALVFFGGTSSLPVIVAVNACCVVDFPPPVVTVADTAAKAGGALTVTDIANINAVATKSKISADLFRFIERCVVELLIRINGLKGSYLSDSFRYNYWRMLVFLPLTQFVREES